MEDEQLEMVAPDCLSCTHVHDGPTCDAYPAGIPAEILMCEVSHREPYPGDQGILFEEEFVHGESEGHAFRGNQWGAGVTGSEKEMLIDGYKSQKFALDAREELPQELKDYEREMRNEGAFVYYQGSGGQAINEVLRNGEEKYVPDWSTREDMSLMRIRENIGKLDKDFKDAPVIPEGTVLWRGVGEKSGRNIANMQVGQICEDKGFQSHSISPQVGERFAKGWFEPGWEDQSPSTPLPIHRTVIKAITGPGQKGIYGGVVGEFEMLMNRGTKWKVASNEQFEQVRTKGQDPTIYHIVTVVPV